MRDMVAAWNRRPAAPAATEALTGEEREAIELGAREILASASWSHGEHKAHGERMAATLRALLERTAGAKGNGETK